ncbi:MAG: bifunctional glutamate N-acetyltransferase/amino-acid acetyltransferase ArgJ [Verrucomicrobiales bacterium]
MPTTNLNIKDIPGGICAAQGFIAGGIKCGIKNPESPKLDLAIIYSTIPSHGAAMFTQNAVRAAPVRLSEAWIKRTPPRAVVVNSGNANACTGCRGMDDARKMADLTAKALKIKRMEVMVCSTGIIGQAMPMSRIEPRIPELVERLHADGGDEAAAAIMTSDTRPKITSVEIDIEGVPVRIGGIAKGAGMIHPNMATMLAFVTTDANISPAELRASTKEAVSRSFNRISVDGDTSTNDTAIVLANGAAGNVRISRGSEHSRLFREALTKVMLRLGKMIVGDGERITRLVEVVVRGARSQSDAERAARAVGNSLLVKSSWNGGDPNWGRILHAVGYSGAHLREEQVDIFIDGLCAARHGLASATPYEKLAKVVANREFTVTIDLNLGSGNFNLYTSDLSPEYVDFNRTEYSAKNKK